MGLLALIVALIIGSEIGGNLRATPTPEVITVVETVEKMVVVTADPPSATSTPAATSNPGPEPGDTWTRPADGMEMVYVPAGEFEMGSNDAADDEKLVHTVKLDAFWIDQTEVTNAQYEKCVQAGACVASDYKDDATYNGPMRPVVGVDWHNAQAYCSWAGGQLPTEAQWEYAARGPGGLKYPWGNTFDRTRLNLCDKNCSYVWADKAMNDGYQYTAPVGSYPAGASWVGALDMAGNVWEWVADWYGAYPAGTQINPTGPTSGESKAVRGGSWYLNVWYVRTAARYKLTPTYRVGYVGFRCVAVRQD